jgi:type I restriction enzyme R subunit
VEHLDYNLEKINQIYADISRLFTLAEITDFSHLPEGSEDRGRFAKLYSSLNSYLEAAKIQGFTWEQREYSFQNPDRVVEVAFDENTYLILALRYKELFAEGSGGGEDIPFDIDGHLIAIDTGRIDTEYMNSRFKKYLKILLQEDVDKDQLQETLDELHKSFATLTQEEQKYANIFIHDVQSGNAVIEDDKTFRDYITEYQYRGKNEQIQRVVSYLGIDEDNLRDLMNSGVKESSINEYGHFDELKASADRKKAKEYFEKIEGTKIPTFKVNIRVHNLLQEFILKGGFEIEIPEE